uniref:Anaphase-promoting complex subunit 13 n=1 Tax=Caenorhabditis tropicalis TaxID=1561998 RepID=A0A1I7V3X7_9PELO
MVQFDHMSEEAQALLGAALQDHEYFFFPIGLEEDQDEAEVIQPNINDVDHEEDADADFVLNNVLNGGRGERATRRALRRS